MTLTLDPATEQLLQQELATGRYRDPDVPPENSTI
jgi:hypothetical protein